MFKLTSEEMKEATKELQEELWNEFCDPEENGVNMEDVLNGAVDVMGARLTEQEIQSVVDHYNDQENWTDEDEEVRDLIADLTDSEDGNKLLVWYTYTSGDQAAQAFLDQYKD